MSDFAGWVPDRAEDVQDAAASTQAAASVTSSWLPVRVQRAQAHEAAVEARQEREAQAAREAAAESRREAGLELYRQQAELRGDFVSVMDLQTGQAGGRTVEDIFASASRAADADDRRSEARDRNAEWVGVRDDIPAVRRAQDASSADPFALSYEAQRMIDRAREGHAWMVAYRARHNYPAALDAARSKATRGGDVSRSAGAGCGCAVCEQYAASRSAPPAAEDWSEHNRRVEALMGRGYSYIEARQAVYG